MAQRKPIVEELESCAQKRRVPGEHQYAASAHEPPLYTRGCLLVRPISILLGFSFPFVKFPTNELSPSYDLIGSLYSFLRSGLRSSMSWKDRER